MKRGAHSVNGEQPTAETASDAISRCAWASRAWPRSSLNRRLLGDGTDGGDQLIDVDAVANGEGGRGIVLV